MRPRGTLPGPGDDHGASGQIRVPASILMALGAGRRRIALRRLLEVAAWAGAAAATVYVAVAAAGLLLPATEWSLGGSRTAFAVAIVVFALGLALAWWRVLRAPTALADVARQADVRFGLDERLATVVDLARGATPGDPNSPVVQAMLRDAERRVRALGSMPLVPLRVPRAAWCLPFLIAAGYALTPTEPRPPVVVAEDAVIVASRAILNADAGDASAGVLAVAAVLSEAAREVDDPYLAAVANSLRDLAERLDAGELNAALAEGELAGLLEHAERALAASESALTDAGADLSSDGAASGGGDPPSESSPGTASSPAVLAESGVPTGEATAMNESAPTAEPSLAAAPRLGLDALVAEAEASSGRESEGGPPGTAEAAEFAETDPELAGQGEGSGGPGDAESDVVLATFRMEGPADENGAPAATPGSMAGLAAQLLFGGDENYDEYYAELLAEMSDPGLMPLSMRTATGGLPLPIELPPETELATVRDAAVAATGWRRTEEEPVPPGDLGLAHRDVASRYFQSLIEQPDDVPAP